MFKFRHNLLKSGILRGKTDIHCHVLPGVDDGSPDMPHSLDLLDYMEIDLGFKAIWLTPHVMEANGNTPDRLRPRMEELRRLYQGKMQLHLSSEYMMDIHFHEHLEAGPLRLGDQHLLVETSYVNGPNDLLDILLSVWHLDMKPLIAHPERYMYMDEHDYQQLKGLGYEFQLNLLSLSGYYGPRAKVVAEHLLADGMYDNVGTDLHHLDRYEDYLYSLRLTRRQIDAIEELFAHNEHL